MRRSPKLKPTTRISRFESLERRELLTSVTLTASQDNSLFEDPQGALSNGTGQHLFVGPTLQAAGRSMRRGLVAFDLEGVIPSGASIDGVSLSLNLSKTISAEVPVSLHRLDAAWGEGTSDAPGMEGTGAPATPGDATWNHGVFPDEPWSTPGGDFQNDASATINVGSEKRRYVWSSAGMIADVEAWLLNPASNFGWVLIGDEGAPGSAKRFDSKEHADVALRPALTIEFTEQAVVPTVNVASVSEKEGDVGTSPLRFPVSLSGPTREEVSFRFTTVDGSARAGEDFVPISDIITFAPNEPLTKLIRVELIGDLLPEADEMFTVEISEIVGAKPGDIRAEGTIINDDPAPTITITDATIAEGTGGLVTAELKVRLSHPSELDVTVDFATVTGTATQNDFVAASGTLMFFPGEIEQTVFVEIQGDEDAESSEVFTVQLSNPMHAELATADFGSVTILDDEPVIQTPWHNAALPADVNGDGSATARDVLAMIAYININGAGPVPEPTDESPPPFYDVTGDNQISSRDVLFAISYINGRIRMASPAPVARQPAAVGAEIAFALLGAAWDDQGERQMD